MSKPVTHEEVEDVLSSIRRLVSEEKRPLAGLRAAPMPEPDRQPAQMPAASTGKLVLTPALRVAEDAGDGSAEEVRAPAEDSPLDLGSVARQTWTAPAAQEEDTLDALVHSTLEAQQTLDEEEGDYGDETYWEVEEDDRTLDDGLTGHTDDIEDFDAGGTLDLQERGALQDAPAAGDLATGADDGAAPDEDLTMRATAAAAPDQPGDDATARAAASAAQSTAKPSAPLPQPQGGSRVLPLTAKIAALEAALGETLQEFEPDGGDAQAALAVDVPTIAWEDDTELDARGAPLRPAPEEIADSFDFTEDARRADETPDEDPAEAQQVPPIGAAFGADDQLMDEDALRDLVSEIVRAELQGALGERITRNVRKLVRREIHRALTAQELE